MPDIGKIGWLDLTVDDAVAVSDFYCQVVGWERSAVDLDGYQDFCVHQPGNQTPAAGICHKIGENAEMPSRWMMYVTVADLDQSMQKCQSLGGKLVCGRRDMGSFGVMCVIEDPAGAVVALIQPPV